MTKLFSKLTALIGLSLLAMNASAILIEVVPASQTVTVGDPVLVEIVVSRLGDGTAESLGAFDFDLDFDPAVVSFSGNASDVIFSNQLDLGFFGSIPDFLPGVGTINIAEVSLEFTADLELLQAPAFTLATVRFNALAAGTSVLLVSVNELANADFPASILAPDNAIALGAVTVEAAPTQAPEPASLLLMGIGLVGLGLGARRSA